MPSTVTLQTTANWSSGFVDFISLNIGSGGANNEPAITNANTILQTILGPPFKWNWNRAVLSPITTVAGTQDYPLAAANFGFLEGASVVPASGTTCAITEIKQDLTVGSEQGQPVSMAAQLDDGAGNITFRFLPVPDGVYMITPYVQKSPPSLFTSLSGTWTPIPDKFEYLYNWGFLALAMAYDDDARFPIINQKFIAHLLGAQQGLSETEKNLFLETWNIQTRQIQNSQIKSQQGRQALGV